MKFISFEYWLNEAEKNLDIQEKWLINLNIKNYPIIIPPTNLNEIKKLLKKQDEKGGESSKEDMPSAWIKDALSGKDIGTLGHEVIHQIQQEKTDLFNNLPPLDYLGDPEVEWEIFDKDIDRKKYYYSRPPEIMAFAWTYYINKDESIKKEYERIGGKIYKQFSTYIKNYSENKNAKQWITNFNKNKNNAFTIKVEGYNLPIVIISKEQWPEGKNDPTEFDSGNNTVRVRSDYDYKKDPLNWLRHELIHYLLHKKKFKDDGKDYPTNNTEAKAYTYQFKNFKKQGIKNFEDLPDLGKKQHEQILRIYWENA